MVLKFEFHEAERQTLLELCRCADTLERIAESRLDKPLNKTVLQEQRAQQIVYARLLASLRLPDVPDELKRTQHRTGVRTPYQLRVVK